MQIPSGSNKNEVQSRVPTRVFTVVTIDCLLCSVQCMYSIAECEIDSAFRFQAQTALEPCENSASPRFARLRRSCFDLWSIFTIQWAGP